MTIAHIIAQKISQAYSDLHDSFQQLRTRVAELESALIESEKENEKLLNSLTKFEKEQRDLFEAIENERRLYEETLKLHNSRISKLERIIKE